MRIMKSTRKAGGKWFKVRPLVELEVGERDFATTLSLDLLAADVINLRVNEVSDLVGCSGFQLLHLKVNFACLTKINRRVNSLKLWRFASNEKLLKVQSTTETFSSLSWTEFFFHIAIQSFLVSFVIWLLHHLYSLLSWRFLFERINAGESFVELSKWKTVKIYKNLLFDWTRIDDGSFL